MAYRERDIEKLYYSIGEVADMLNVKPSKVRFYEQYFGLDGKRNRTGERKYTTDEIARIALIFWLTRWGVTMERTKKLYKEGKAEECKKMIELL